MSMTDRDGKIFAAMGGTDEKYKKWLTLA